MDLQPGIRSKGQIARTERAIIIRQLEGMECYAATAGTTFSLSDSMLGTFSVWF